jgi:hypothetical protein
MEKQSSIVSSAKRSALYRQSECEGPENAKNRKRKNERPRDQNQKPKPKTSP